MYAEKKRLVLGRLPDRYIYHNVPITPVKSSVGTESLDPVVSINLTGIRPSHTYMSIRSSLANT